MQPPNPETNSSRQDELGWGNWNALALWWTRQATMKAIRQAGRKDNVQKTKSDKT